MHYLLFFNKMHGFLLRKEKNAALDNEIHVATLQGSISKIENDLDQIGEFETIGKKICTTDDDIVKIQKIEWLHPEIGKYKEKEKNILFTPAENKK